MRQQRYHSSRPHSSQPPAAYRNGYEIQITVNRAGEIAMIRSFNEQVLLRIGQQLKQVIGVGYLSTATFVTNRRLEAGGFLGRSL